MKPLVLISMMAALSTPLWAAPLLAMEKEALYEKFGNDLVNTKLRNFSVKSELTKEESKIYLDALMDYSSNQEDPSENTYLRSVIENANNNNFSNADQVRLLVLAKKNNVSPARLEVLKVKFKKLLKAKLDNRTIYMVFSYQKDLTEMGLETDINAFVKSYHAEKIFFDKIFSSPSEAKTKDQLNDLYHQNLSSSPKLAAENRTAIYVFCRAKRDYTCLMLMKDNKGFPIYKSDGTLFSLPVLGLSKFGLTFNISNGNTPAGVYLINGVNPVADQQFFYGKSRRLILNFFKKENNYDAIKKILPESLQSQWWWKQSILADVLGRDLLRIHGTGDINLDPKSNYFPFVPSSGCLKTREGTYGDTKYNDQNIVLTQLMLAQGMSSTYANQLKIKSVMYLVEIDSQEKAVGFEEIESYLR